MAPVGYSFVHGNSWALEVESMRIWDPLVGSQGTYTGDKNEHTCTTTTTTLTLTMILGIDKLVGLNTSTCGMLIPVKTITVPMIAKRIDDLNMWVNLEGSSSTQSCFWIIGFAKEHVFGSHNKSMLATSWCFCCFLSQCPFPCLMELGLHFSAFFHHTQIFIAFAKQMPESSGS